MSAVQPIDLAVANQIGMLHLELIKKSTQADELVKRLQQAEAEIKRLRELIPKPGAVADAA